MEPLRPDERFALATAASDETRDLLEEYERLLVEPFLRDPDAPAPLALPAGARAEREERLERLFQLLFRPRPSE